MTSPETNGTSINLAARLAAWRAAIMPLPLGVERPASTEPLSHYAVGQDQIPQTNGNVVRTPAEAGPLDPAL